MTHPTSPRRRAGAATLALALLAGAARADLDPEWIASLPTGSALGAGLQAFTVDAAGVSYVTGNTGPSGNTDVVTAAFGPDGALLWSHVYNGPGNWHDQGRGLALGTGGVLYVTGNTPSPSKQARVLLLAYDAASGALLSAQQYVGTPGVSEHGAAVVADAAGNVYIGGGTVGDGGDALMMKIDSAGAQQWVRTWDGAAWGPYSQDNVLQMKLAPDGAPLAMLHGVMASLHPDYVVLKLDPADGSSLWEANWGVSGGDFPADMQVDAGGDVFVTGTGLDFIDKFSTIRLRGSDGALVWQAYDWAGLDDHARALWLDGQGGVYITGSVDPDGDESNNNDNIYTVKRDASDGSLLWTHLYGANCVGCLDAPSDVVVDPQGHVFVAGSTSSPPYSGDAITLVLDAGTGVETDRGVVSGSATQSAGTGFLGFDGGWALYEGGRTYDFNSGAVAISVLKYASQLGPGPVVYCTAKQSSCGAVPTIGGPSAVAGASAGSGSYDVSCGPVPAGGNQGILIYTTNGSLAAPIANVFGFLCVDNGPGFFRVPTAVTPTGAGCAAGYLFDFGGHLASQTIDKQLAPGAQVDLQAWYRDPPAAGGANLSNAMTFWVGP